MAVLLGAPGQGTVWEAARGSAFTSAYLSLLLLAAGTSPSGHRPTLLAALQRAQIDLLPGQPSSRPPSPTLLGGPWSWLWWEPEGGAEGG